MTDSLYLRAPRPFSKKHNGYRRIGDQSPRQYGSMSSLLAPEHLSPPHPNRLSLSASTHNGIYPRNDLYITTRSGSMTNFVPVSNGSSTASSPTKPSFYSPQFIPTSPTVAQPPPPALLTRSAYEMSGEQQHPVAAGRQAPPVQGIDYREQHSPDAFLSKLRKQKLEVVGDLPPEDYSYSTRIEVAAPRSTITYQPTPPPRSVHKTMSDSSIFNDYTPSRMGVSRNWAEIQHSPPHHFVNQQFSQQPQGLLAPRGGNLLERAVANVDFFEDADRLLSVPEESIRPVRQWTDLPGSSVGPHEARGARIVPIHYEQPLREGELHLPREPKTYTIPVQRGQSVPDFSLAAQRQQNLEYRRRMREAGRQRQEEERERVRREEERARYQEQEEERERILRERERLRMEEEAERRRREEEKEHQRREEELERKRLHEEALERKRLQEEAIERRRLQEEAEEERRRLEEFNRLRQEELERERQYREQQQLEILALQKERERLEGDRIREARERAIRERQLREREQRLYFLERDEALRQDQKRKLEERKEPNFPKESVAANIPVRTRSSPFVNQRLPDEDRSQPAQNSSLLQRAVETKVFGSGRVNGFTTKTVNVPDPMSTSYPGPSAPRERSFAVVSRPTSPPVAMISPTKTLARPATPQSPYDNMEKPPSRVTSPQQRVTSPLPRQQPTRVLSPTSALIEEHRRTRVVSPQGILLHKAPNENGGGGNGGPKPQKKVVFQCDPEVMRRLARCEQENNQGAAPGAASAEVPNAVRDYDDAIEESLNNFFQLGDRIGGDLSTANEKARSLFASLRSFLWTAAGRAEPDQSTLQSLLAPLVKLLEDIGGLREAKRNTPLFNHLSAIAEGIQAVGWVTVKPTPAPFIKEMLDSAMFYVNRVLKEHKEDADQVHVDWTKAWVAVLTQLQTFVRKTHTTGLVWNTQPGAAPPASAAASASLSPPKAAAPPPPPPGGPPPPPPPIPAGLLGEKKDEKKDDGRAELFAELNRGEAVTANLKKVTADMQTHKNPNLRAAASAGGAASSAPKSAAAAPSKPPRIELENFKQWIVEYHKGNKNIVVEIEDKKQTLYVYRCEDSVIQVKGKLNSITLDSCKKTSIVFDSLLAQIETINCQSIQIQALGEMPTISIQKTDGCQVYLSDASKNAEIVTSKSSEMNVLVPKGDGDFSEFPVPEQFKTVFNGNKLVTTASDII